MQVFKTFLKIAVRKIPSVILYFVIFAIIAILLSSDAEQKNGFESTKLSISVHDLDNTTASHELISFIEQNHTLVYIVISMGAAMLVAQFDINENTIPMVSNVFGLGMSFLCGVFVPQNLLSSLVLGIAKFLPAYWFVKANNMLYGVGDTAFTMTKYLTYLGIELLFAIALFSAVMAVSKSKMQTSE